MSLALSWALSEVLGVNAGQGVATLSGRQKTQKRNKWLSVGDSLEAPVKRWRANSSSPMLLYVHIDQTIRTIREALS